MHKSDSGVGRYHSMAGTRRGDGSTQMEVFSSVAEEKERNEDELAMTYLAVVIQRGHYRGGYWRAIPTR